MKIEIFDNTMKTFQGIPADEKNPKKPATYKNIKIQYIQEMKRLPSDVASGSAFVPFVCSCSMLGHIINDFKGKLAFLRLLEWLTQFPDLKS